MSPIFYSPDAMAAKARKAEADRLAALVKPPVRKGLHSTDYLGLLAAVVMISLVGAAIVATYPFGG